MRFNIKSKSDVESENNIDKKSNSYYTKNKESKIKYATIVKAKYILFIYNLEID